MSRFVIRVPFRVEYAAVYLQVVDTLRDEACVRDQMSHVAFDVCTDFFRASPQSKCRRYVDPRWRRYSCVIAIALHHNARSVINDSIGACLPRVQTRDAKAVTLT